MFFYIICGLNVDYIFGLNEDDIYESSNEGDIYESSNESDICELNETNTFTDPHAHRLDLSDEGDDHYHSSIPDLVDSRDSGEWKIPLIDTLPPYPLDLDDGRNNKLPDLGESEDGGETGESEDGRESFLSESEGSFVMLELNKGEEEVQDQSTEEPREEQTETILEEKLANNEEEENFDASVDAEQRGEKMEEKLETEIFYHKNEIQKMVSSVENSEAILGELIVKLSTATSEAEFYRLQALESKGNLHILEKERTDLIIKLSIANASARLYRSLLHDLDL